MLDVFLFALGCLLLFFIEKLLEPFPSLLLSLLLQLILLVLNNKSNYRFLLKLLHDSLLFFSDLSGDFIFFKALLAWSVLSCLHVAKRVLNHSTVIIKSWLCGCIVVSVSEVELVVVVVISGDLRSLIRLLDGDSFAGLLPVFVHRFLF